MIGGGEGGDARGVANGDTGDFAAGLDTGATVARGPDVVACGASGGRTTWCGDVGTMGATGTTLSTRLVGPATREGAAGIGPTVAWALRRAGTPRASGAASTFKTRTTLSAAASVTITRPTNAMSTRARVGDQAGSPNRCNTKLKPKRMAPAATATATGRRSTLVPSNPLPPIAPIVTPTTISRSCSSAPKAPDARQGPLRRR